MSILARIMAAQAARDHRAIEMAPSAKYLRLANSMLYIIESHDVGNKVQKKMTTLAPEYEGGMWVTRGRSHPGPADSSATAIKEPRERSQEGPADDPGATDDRRERPQPGPAEGPGQPKKLQQGPPTSRERPNKGSAEDPKQPKELQQRPSPPQEWPHQVGLADVNFDLADIQINPAEVLPGRVRNLPGPQSSKPQE